MARRSQAERSDTTTTRLISAARLLFGRDGYTTTSIDAVAAAAGVTKGAAYHHFKGKADLFRAVFVREQEEIAAGLERVALAAPDSWTALRYGVRAFLERCTDPAFRQVVLLDGPAVLGWDGVRAIEYDHTLRVLAEGMRAAADDGRIVAGDLAARTQMIFGALCEAGMLLARSGDPAAALPAVEAEAEHLLSALATQAQPQ
ncbi:TetR/AcrR family transcriptional regulator [Spirillospora sp. NPDC047279]|uniref:TetR/AcrR family transcriptional regulator n=1 Tax=Spirillospora sp. NPDC047279 TaxID=3155478 RepID=UPI0033DD2626